MNLSEQGARSALHLESFSLLGLAGEKSLPRSETQYAVSEFGTVADSTGLRMES